MRDDFDLDGRDPGRDFANPGAAAVHHARHRHPSRREGWRDIRGSDVVAKTSASLAMAHPGWAIGIAFAQQRTGECHVSVDHRESGTQLDVWAGSPGSLLGECLRAVHRHQSSR